MCALRINYTTEWQKRPCPVCGEQDDLQNIGKRSYSLPADPNYYTFEMEDVVCGYCGFVFALKVPAENFIEGYYRSTSIRVAANYNKENRVAIIKRLVPEGSSIMEIGPGYEGLRYLIGKQYDVDILNVGNELPEKKYDLVTAYYVLEHIINPRQFIRNMRSLVKDGGYIIVEVPDFQKYPAEAFFKEHFNYFTKHHLRIMLMAGGFDVIEMIDGHSRYFGFVAVAKAMPPTIEKTKEGYACIEQ